MTPRCGHCGYNLTGAPGNRCPECGWLFIDAGVIVRSDRRRSPWRSVVVRLALVVLVGIAGVSYFGIRAAQARASAEAARAMATRAFLQQSLAAQNAQSNSRVAVQELRTATQSASRPVE
ncbi:MAG: hypothetical protein AMXMBFR47_24410 [Planctomycetota bacterium]